MNRHYVRFSDREFTGGAYGILENDSVTPLDAAPWTGGKPQSAVRPLSSVKLLAPVEPSKIVCIGLNYHAHVAASFSAEKPPEEPLMFLKPPSSVIGPGDKIIHPPQSERVDYEAELGVVMGKKATKVSGGGGGAFISSASPVSTDVTARDLQKKDGQWSRAKGFDTFCPVGPWIVAELDWIVMCWSRGFSTRTVKQSGRTSLMIFDIPFLVSYISQR